MVCARQWILTVIPPAPASPAIQPTNIQVYGNSFKKCEVGSIKAMRDPQGVICDNECEGDSDACELREKG